MMKSTISTKYNKTKLVHKIIQVLKILGFELCLVRKCSAAKLFFIRRLKVTAEKKYSASIYGHIDKNPV